LGSRSSFSFFPYLLALVNVLFNMLVIVLGIAADWKSKLIAIPRAVIEDGKSD